MKKVHIIVATGKWEQDQLRYRRHRLAEFLQHQPDTEKVIWLCPTPKEEENSYTLLANGVNQWTVQDLLPQKVFRFGRYVDQFYEKKLQPFLLYLGQLQEQYTLQLWYTFPGFPLLADLFDWNKVIYDCSDLWTSPMNGKPSIPSAVRQRIIARAEGRIIQRADVIFCTSEYLRTKIAEKQGTAEKVFTFENGVEFDLFSNPPVHKENVLPAGFDGTVLGFIGGIKPKLDFALVQEAARKKREWLFLFVGPDGTNGHPAFKQLINEKNVLWTGSVAPSDVPKYMDIIDIGMMPYKSSQYNKAVFPLKLFEFLAAGKSVVGLHLPSTKKYAEESIYTYLDTDDSDQFIRACEQLEGFKDQEDYIRKRKILAKTKNWNEVFTEMVKLI
ncbi:teichuronic acid biosynthesis protein TuaH [Neobacillus kokaensis]|uniref:Teichuronic acid biosynthesis glycosyltransferase TuaH n=1 Tax=Neobacillus kokaensis TaxID=2759023 RepID=A0ABQ3N9R3_9BACI|nr:glycosyltransferase [Neobacillus kokaensis]GHH99505.1 putative teichuronic acid biosynthesis glycosyltransferase TuaH [Neobacillus kokaensis]